MTVDLMRKQVIDAYHGPMWRLKVLAMDDRQVIAIYHSMLAEGRLKPVSSRTRKHFSKEDSVQLTIWDLPEMKREDIKQDG